MSTGGQNQSRERTVLLEYATTIPHATHETRNQNTLRNTRTTSLCQ